MQGDESTIREKLQAGDARGAMTLALARYGPELYGFIRHVVQSEDDAKDIYASLCEDLWKGLPQFRWESSFRTWAYVAARHACQRHVRRVGHAPRGHASAGIVELASQLPATPRTETATYLRTEVKSRFAALREKLSEDERMLLTLRVDRELSWDDIALVMLDSEAERRAASTATLAATCRKRFERTKEKLRALAIEEGLLREDE
jgi:RNA polymerase sigma-70 factor (ECF subfamily)